MKKRIIFVFALAVLLPLSGCLGLAPANEDGDLVLYSFDADEPICFDGGGCGDGIDDGEIILEMIKGGDIAYSVVRISVGDVDLPECGQGEETNCWDKSDAYDNIWSVDDYIRLYTDNEGTYSVTITVMEYGEEPYGNTVLGEVYYSHEVSE